MDNIRIKMVAADIINAAFRTWGDDMYMKTSLSTLAASLGITKPALYRYFKDKDELLGSMLDCYIQAHTKATAEVLPKLESMSFRDGFAAYAKSMFNFYSKNRGYFYFAARFLLERKHPFHERILSVVVAEAAAFTKVLHAQTELTEKQIELVLTTGYTHLLFWCELLVGKNKIQFPGGIASGMQAMTDSLFDGFFTGIEPSDFHPGKIESAIDLDESELPKSDPRIEAIMEVIAREGFHKASISKIAQALNISKSSLYSLFKDKREMLAKVMRSYREMLNATGTAKLACLDMPFDRFYGYFYFVLLSFVKDEKKAKFLNWLRFQNIQPHEGKAGFNFEAHQAVRDVFAASMVNHRGLDARYLDGCFRVQLVRAVLEKMDRKEDLKDVFSDFREIFSYLTFGLEKTLGI